MSAYQGQFLTYNPPTVAPPALAAADLASIAKFLNDAADALDPSLLSDADKARVPRGKIRAGNKLSAYLRYQADIFEKGANGEITPNKAFSTIRISRLTNWRFQTIVNSRIPNPNVSGVNQIREHLRQVVSIADTRPFASLTRWSPPKLLKSVLAGVIAVPVAVSMGMALWKQDGADAVASDFFNRLGYSADRVFKSSIPEGKVLVCEFKYSANSPDSPERRQYRQSALEIAREKAQGKDGLGGLAAEFERGVNVYIHTHHPGLTPEEGVEIVQEDGGCAANATQIEAFTPR